MRSTKPLLQVIDITARYDMKANVKEVNLDETVVAVVEGQEGILP